MNPSGDWKLGHRPGLDGVRGVAILLVLVAHAHVWSNWPRPLPDILGGGSSIGVTIFFVLSGFLITALLAEELRDTGRIDVGAFYRRRALRLLPALVLLLVVLVAVSELAGSWHYLALQQPLTATQVTASLFYAANWVTIYGHDHSLGLLNHTWSLSVEEQFYFAWPALLIGGATLFGLRSRRLLGALIALALASAGEAVWLYWSSNGTAGGRVYFGTDTRACSLLIGGALALWLVANRPLRVVPSFLVAGACLFAIAFWYSANRFVFKVPLAATLGGLIVIAAALQRGRVSAILSWRPLRWTGRISYGLYLWHYPIILVLQPMLAKQRSLVALAVMVLASYAAATASYYLVERYFLRLKRRASRVPKSVPATSLG